MNGETRGVIWGVIALVVGVALVALLGAVVRAQLALDEAPAISDAGNIVQELANPADSERTRLEAEIAHLKESFGEDRVQIFKESDTAYTLYVKTSGSMTKWRTMETLEGARLMMAAYWEEWARNCLGDTPVGVRVQ